MTLELSIPSRLARHHAVMSLLITVLVQTIVAVLGLRGSNLRWGFTQLLTR